MTIMLDDGIASAIRRDIEARLELLIRSELVRASELPTRGEAGDFVERAPTHSL